MQDRTAHPSEHDDPLVPKSDGPVSAFDSAVMGYIAAWELARDHGETVSIEALCQGDAAVAQQVFRGLIRLGYRHEVSEQSKNDSPKDRLEADHSDFLASGQMVGPYQIVRLLGQGGMGVVYAAQDSTLNRKIALKLMKPEMIAMPTARARFIREARSAAAVTHDNLLPILHVGEYQGCPYIAMPLLSGETLTERLARGPLTADEVKRLSHEAASGLAAAHTAGLVHRDIKPSNLWLEQLDEQEACSLWRVKVFDFGLARTMDGIDQLSVRNLPMGTPAYMSPEQADGRLVDHRTDLFSLGVVLYQAAVGGSSPFRRDSLTSMLRAISEYNPPPLHEKRPDLSSTLVSLIHRMIEKDPEHRPSSAREVANLARGDSHQEIINNQHGTGKHRIRRAISYRTMPSKMLIIFGLISVVCILAIVGWATGRLPDWAIKQDSLSSATEKSKHTVALEPLRIISIDVNHIEMINDKNEGNSKGLLGKKSFAARLGDHVTVQVQLARPAYAYLIAYRPDGVAELCFPEDPDEIPTLSDQPRYPSKSRGVNYGLTDGTGLWVIGVIASDQPLPSYREWIKKHGELPWKPEKVEPGTVWLDDGQWVESISQAGVVRGERGGGAKVPGKSTVVNITDILKSRAEHATAAAIGFGVSTR